MLLSSGGENMDKIVVVTDKETLTFEGQLSLSNKDGVGGVLVVRNLSSTPSVVAVFRDWLYWKSIKARKPDKPLIITDSKYDKSCAKTVLTLNNGKTLGLSDMVLAELVRLKNRGLYSKPKP